MKLVAHTSQGWSFQLNPQEASLLQGLLRKFPFRVAGRVEISKSDDSAGAAERQKLLTESLTEHRKELRRLARALLEEDKWRPSPAGLVLTVNPESREILLQILNDIRLGCWHALGEPDDLDQLDEAKPPSVQRALMELAGYFEMHLLDPDIRS